jgi:anti-sigma factor RsiW
MEAREAISARLDGELGELDAARLESHLRVCPDCGDFAAEATAGAALLRDAALEQPPAWTWTEPARTRRRFGGLVGAAAVAVAVVAAAAAPSFLLGRTIGQQPQTRTATRSPAAYEPARSLLDPALLAMLQGQRNDGGRIIHL